MTISVIEKKTRHARIRRNHIWNEITDLPANYENGIEISNNASVIINNLDLNFNPGAQIIVDAGSYLRISDSRLSCKEHDKLWKGILVNGIAHAAQSVEGANGKRQQGVLILRGSSDKEEQSYTEILNAETGVEVGAGAVVQAFMTRFVNCSKGAVIRPYSRPDNLCMFDRCVFRWENTGFQIVEIPGHIDFNDLCHIEMGRKYEGKSGVNGVTIFACEFGNYISHPDIREEQLGKGLCASDSIFFIQKAHIFDRGVLDSSPSSKVNAFYNLYQGIHLCGSSTLGDMDAGMNDFFNCKLDVSYSDYDN